MISSVVVHHFHKSPTFESMSRKINLQQYRNYNRGWKYLLRIFMYAALLILIWIFVKYKLPKEQPEIQDEGIEVFLEQ